MSTVCKTSCPNVDEGDKCKLDTVLLFSDFKSSDGQKQSNIRSNISNKSV